jgi:hypothetical protein
LITLSQAFDYYAIEWLAGSGRQASGIKLPSDSGIVVLLQQLVYQTNDRSRGLSKCPCRFGNWQMKLPGGASFESDLHADVLTPLQGYIFDQ